MGRLAYFLIFNCFREILLKEICHFDAQDTSCIFRRLGSLLSLILSPPEPVFSMEGTTTHSGGNIAACGCVKEAKSYLFMDRT
jgi:hypothetical protein